MSNEQVVNYVVLIILVGALVIGLLSMLVGRIVDAWDRLCDWWGVGVQKAIHYRPVPTSPEPDEPEVSTFPLLNHEEPRDEPIPARAELWLNQAEVDALHRMIRHNATAAKPSKTSTIQAGFGLSRGGSAAYQRASLIYDALFGAPPPAVKYRERTPEQEALRQQLRLGK